MGNTLGSQKINRLGERLFCSIVPVVRVVTFGKLVVEVTLNIPPAKCEKRLNYPVLI